LFSFNDFLEIIPKLKKMPLPGEKAQLEMAAVERLQELQQSHLKKQIPREAAVMMLVYNKNDVPYFALIERMISKGKHSGQIAFPGGRAEPEDADFKHTALRETEEEIGIAIKDQEVIIAGTPIYIPPSNYMVRPYLAVMRTIPLFKAQASEVQSIIEIPLQDLMDDANISQQELTTSYMVDVKVPCFMLQGHIVWGATAMMLNEYRQLLKDFM
jgi:8-oxo-dGTP pyrophosphatase MutT (NUDIX family)